MQQRANQVSSIEKWILENPKGTAKEFGKAPAFIFNEIKNNNTIATALIKNSEYSLDDLFFENKIQFEISLTDYSFESVSNLKEDYERAINETEDEVQRKKF